MAMLMAKPRKARLPCGISGAVLAVVGLLAAETAIAPKEGLQLTPRPPYVTQSAGQLKTGAQGVKVGTAVVLGPQVVANGPQKQGLTQATRATRAALDVPTYARSLGDLAQVGVEIAQRQEGR